MKDMLDEAVAQYKRVLEIDNHNADAHVSLGVAYRAKGMIKEAISEYQRAMSIDSDIAGKAHNNLAVLYYYEKQYEEAVHHCNKAVELGFEVQPRLLKNLKPHK
jgi:tetratricopeptide (TPR) repeat protein